MKRLSYLRAEAADCVDTFEESVKEIEDRLGDKKKNSSNPSETNDESVSSRKKDASTSMILSTDKKEKQQSTDDKDTSSDTNSEVEEKQQESIETETDVQYRKLWREIAKLTHPDVSRDDENVVALYKAAAEAHEKKKHGELLDVASEVGVILSDPHELLLVDAHKRCVHYENLITKVRDSIAWQWKNSAEATQNQIIELILKSRSEKSEAQE